MTPRPSESLDAWSDEQTGLGDYGGEDDDESDESDGEREEEAQEEEGDGTA